ncbi:MAG: putative N-acetylglucosamine kinase, glucokinase-like [Rhodanobacteraceae bacterium]|jgi:hypothetical protein|nr:MAG: putative N-acetylglucosamine kinase, glucokinase-like [Rhodanobacteraceae bacterium]
MIIFAGAADHLSGFLQHVPVRLIEHGRHGVLGAARWYIDRLSQGIAHRRVPGDGTAA